MSENIEITKIYLEKRVIDFINDPFIKDCLLHLEKIHNYAKPIIKVCVTDPTLSVFDIDEESKSKIEFWKDKIEEHKQKYYSDIFKTAQ